MEKTVEEQINPDPENGKKLNPWLTIWYKPRATFRSAINNKSMKLAFILAMLMGMIELFDRAIEKNMGHHMSTVAVLVMIIVLGAIVGIVLWFIWSAISYYVGKLLKGKGTIQEMNIAIGISFIPLAVSGIFYILDIIFLREALFIDTYLTPFQIVWLLISAFFVFILAVWSVFLMVKAIAEVHQFSAWKGLLTLIIPVIVVFILLAILLVLII